MNKTAHKIFTCTFFGLNCRTIEVQADISNGLPAFSIVGLGDTSVQESKERIRSGIKNSGLNFPLNRKTINLAPAQIRKQGSHFDLPIALALLIADGQLNPGLFNDALILGELSLTGSLKPVIGILPITQFCKLQGFKKIFLPKDNALEASFIEGINIYPVDNLKELISHANYNTGLKLQEHSKINTNIDIKKAEKFSQIIGMEKAKRALSIAASGGHNCLLSGTPGSGKTVICRAFQEVIPPMSNEEILETSKIYSISGLLQPDKPLITKRPFREIHHSASSTSIIGGGNNSKPGEISLSHNGVLFFDEIAEFPRKALEALRQPLEDKVVQVNRQKYSHTFPCNFTFLATMNPCPCGYAGDKKPKCLCTEVQIKNYQKKISGPLLDRFDIFVEVERSSMKEVFSRKNTESKLLSQIQRAYQVQIERFADHPNINKNADMLLKEIKEFCHLDKRDQKFLDNAAEKLDLSNRAYLKTLKLARTIADLEGSPKINTMHISEALQYRRA